MLIRRTHNSRDTRWWNHRYGIHPIRRAIEERTASCTTPVVQFPVRIFAFPCAISAPMVKQRIVYTDIKDLLKFSSIGVHHVQVPEDHSAVFVGLGAHRCDRRLLVRLSGRQKRVGKGSMVAVAAAVGGKNDRVQKHACSRRTDSIVLVFLSGRRVQCSTGLGQI